MKIARLHGIFAAVSVVFGAVSSGFAQQTVVSPPVTTAISGNGSQQLPTLDFSQASTTATVASDTSFKMPMMPPSKASTSAATTTVPPPAPALQPTLEPQIIGYGPASSQVFQSQTSWNQSEAQFAPQYIDPQVYQPGCPQPFAYRQQKPCAKFGEHQSALFGEILYLSARGVNVPYATPVNGQNANAVPIGRVGVASPDSNTGFRAGFWLKLNPKSSLGATYTQFESNSSDSIGLPGGAGFVRSELTHPNTSSVAADSLFASASYDLDFDFFDFDYKRLIYQTEKNAVNYIMGIRYAHLNQKLDARYLITGTTAVQSEIDFDGIGSRAGLTGERLLGKGFYIYGSGFLNFLAGEFSADFIQSNVFNGTQAASGYKDDRIVTQMESEIGIGWHSRCDRFRLSVGHYSSVWFNVITTHTYLDAVRTNDYTELDDILTFDGMSLRAEVRW